jgi:CheY-like chemotaxis protein
MQFALILGVFRRSPWETAGEHRDVILCDMRMPDLDGPGSYRALERHHPYLRSWVIFLTGDVLSAEGQAFFAQSSRLRVIKPFKAAEVRRVIQQVLEAATKK